MNPPNRLSRRRYQKGSIRDDRDRWIVRWREDCLQPDGSVKRVRKWDVLSKKGFPTKRLAQRELDRILASVNSEDFKPVRSETFAQFADRWMLSILPLHKPSSREVERWTIEKRLKPVFGSWQMRDISAEALQTWISQMTYSGKTIRNYKTTLRSMWTQAEQWGYVTHNPFKGLKLPKAARDKAYHFSPEEMVAIIHEMQGWHRILCELLGEVGMRPGEALGLRPEDIETNVMHVRQSVWRGQVQTTKTEGSVRDFYLSTDLESKIRKHIEPNEWGLIFLDKGHPVNENHFVARVLNPILEKLGILQKVRAQGKRCGLYAFRHGNITALRRGGIPLKTIQARVGHTIGSEVTDRYYSHAVTEDDIAAGEYMHALLETESKGSVQ